MRQPASHPAYIFLTGGLFFAFKRRWSPMIEGRLMRDRQLRYFFEEYAFDTDRRELHRGANLVSITPQVFDLLNYLIRHRERVVSKGDLISAVWNGRIVSDAALTTRLNAARAAIGDGGDKQRLIKTLPRKGFRFVGTVHEGLRSATGSASSVAQNDDAAQRPLSPPRLSIVVLPFANLSGDPEQDYFADGVTESLTTDLSRIRGSFVIGRHTAFTYMGKAVDLKQIGRELNVRYILEGSVQRASNRLRVNAQLVDAQTSAHLWADRFDKPIADLFDMQDEIVARLANTLRAELTEAEAERTKRSLHPSSMDLFFQGKASWNKGCTPEYLAQARSLFERALELDPANIDAMVWLASVHATAASSFLIDDKAAQLRQVETKVLKALSLAPNHPGAHVTLGSVLTCTNRAAQGIAECERALALNPSSAEAHSVIGEAKLFLGRGAETEAHMEEALRLSPHDVMASRWLSTIAFSKLQIEADAEALRWFRRSIEVNRNYPIAHFGLATALALLNSLDEAKSAARAGLALDPTFTIRRFRDGLSTDNPTYLAKRVRIYEGMRLAGVPEE
jgi:TolB-like protein/Tfp pilus assembly protein PilF